MTPAKEAPPSGAPLSRPALAEALGRARSIRSDVGCRVEVSVQVQPAALAGVGLSPPVAGFNRFAPGAGRGSVLGTRLSGLLTDPPCLLLSKLLANDSPSLLHYAPVQSRLRRYVGSGIFNRAACARRHVPDFRVLNGHQAVTPHYVRDNAAAVIPVSQALLVMQVGYDPVAPYSFAAGLLAPRSRLR